MNMTPEQKGGFWQSIKKGVHKEISFFKQKYGRPGQSESSQATMSEGLKREQKINRIKETGSSTTEVPEKTLAQLENQLEYQKLYGSEASVKNLEQQIEARRLYEEKITARQEQEAAELEEAQKAAKKEAA